RSIGSTVGVAIFGSLLLSSYHHDFAQAVPANTPPELLKPFSNPLLLAQMRPQLEASFSRRPGGMDLLNTLFANVRIWLLHGLQQIFFWRRIVMGMLLVVNIVLRNVPLRGRSPAPPAPEP